MTGPDDPPDPEWLRITARTCPGCGCKSVKDDGVCEKCGMRKFPDPAQRDGGTDGAGEGGT